MISFYPGPSRIYDNIPRYVRDAEKKGVLSMSHRSAEFMAMYRSVVALLHNKLRVPKTYQIYFASSATECWEIIAQSLVDRGSYHIYSGAFGEKWYRYTQKLKSSVAGQSFSPNDPIDNADLGPAGADTICLTHNETSNGTHLTGQQIKDIRRRFPDHLIAVDATSSMGGVALNFKNADVWFASVQKCFGLPAGLAILICSPTAIKRMQSIDESAHYNSLTLLHAMGQKNQTSCTPNVLGIYLLMRVLRKVKVVEKVEKKLAKRQQQWFAFFKKANHLHLLIQPEGLRSLTVIPVTGSAAHIEKVKKACRRKGFLLGEGYGELQSSTFRIANFPAIRSREIKDLRQILKKYL